MDSPKRGTTWMQPGRAGRGITNPAPGYRWIFVPTVFVMVSTSWAVK
jgi:hypothetical protein